MKNSTEPMKNGAQVHESNSDPLRIGLAASIDTASFIVAEYRHPPGHGIPEHRHAGPAAVLLLGGGFGCTYRRRRRLACRRGGLFVVPPEESHAEQVSGAGSHSLLVFPRPEAGADPAIGALDDLIALNDARTRTAAAWAQRELATPGPDTPLVLESLVLDLLRHAHTFGRYGAGAIGGGAVGAGALGGRGIGVGGIGAGAQAIPSWLHEVRQRLEDELEERHTLARLAEAVGVSRSALASGFKEAFGTTVGQHLRRRRLERAAAALRDGRRSICDVALECGFYDQSHFTAAFRRRFGVTPAAYRKAARG